MKKELVILFSIITIILSMSSCNTSKPLTGYNALQIGGADTLDGGIHASEYSIWDTSKVNYHQDKSAPSQATVSFNGITYTGTYMRSVVRVPNLYVSHRFKGDNVFFEINAETGELSSITFAYEPLKQASLDKKSCEDIAKSIADKYINLDAYTMDVSTSRIYDNYLYSFNFYKEINGYKTADSLTVVVDGNGNINSFAAKMIGSFSNSESVYLDNEKMSIAIDEKLNMIYANNENRTAYDVKSILFVKLEDNSYALLCTIENEFKNSDFSSTSQLELLLVPQH